MFSKSKSPGMADRPGCPRSVGRHGRLAGLRAAALTLLAACITGLALPAAGHASYRVFSELQNSEGMAVGPHGEVYVAESLADRVVQLDSGGRVTRVIGRLGTGDGELARPIKVAVDDTGAIYVSDYGTGRLQKFKADGSFVWSAGGGDGATDLEVAPDGDVWAADPNGRMVRRYSAADGTVVASFTVGDNSVVPGELAVEDNGNVLVALSGAGRVERYSSRGVRLGTVLSNLPATGRLGVARFGDGLLVWGTGFVQRYSGAHTLVGEFPDGIGVDDYDFPLAASDAGDGIAYLLLGENAPASRSRVLRIDTTQPRFTPPQSQLALTGQSLTLDASTASGDLTRIRSFDWDLDGDGSFEVLNGGRRRDVTFGASGLKRSQVRVNLDNGGHGVWSWVFDVRPAPPNGAIGITINNAAQFTNDPYVRINPVWPAMATTALLSNDGGFGAAGTFGVAPALEWRLDTSGPERLPKTVYARFDQSGSQTYQDDIILDQTKPAVTSATVGSGSATSSAAITATASKRRTYRVRVRAKDATSGVAKVQFAVRNKRRPSALRKFKRIIRCKGTRAPKYVRVRDRAGNYSRWRSIRSSALRRAGGRRTE